MRSYEFQEYIAAAQTVPCFRILLSHQEFMNPRYCHSRPGRTSLAGLALELGRAQAAERAHAMSVCWPHERSPRSAPDLNGFFMRAFVCCFVGGNMQFILELGLRGRRIAWAAKLCVLLLVSAIFSKPILAQQNQGTSATSDQVRNLMEKVESLEKRIAELEAREGTQAALPSNSAASKPPESSVTQEVPGVTSRNEPDEPFAFADFTWLNGSSRTKDSPLETKAFTGEFRADVSYIYDLNHPQDHTLSGTSESGRTGEFQVQQLGVGGDLHYGNVRGRVMTQFGMYSTMTPRNDASPGRGNGTWLMLIGIFQKPTAAITSTCCMESTWMQVSSCLTLDCSAITILIIGPTSRPMFRRTHRGFLTACVCKSSQQRS